MMLHAGPAEVRLDPDQGGRIASLRLDGRELLASPDEVEGDPMLWGCYPMVPWAGRVRDGRFTFEGETHQLPLGDPPHAIHGVGWCTAWEATGPGTLRLDLDGGWPLGGQVEQRFDLTPHALTLTMDVTAGARPMPLLAGWHPCFRRRLEEGDVELRVPAAGMWERDGAGIPTGELVSVPPGPWDDCFTGLDGPPRLTWPEASVTLRSECPAWVVYDRDPRVVCVEPQTDAPDAFNRDPVVLAPGEARQIELTMEWTT